jgi:hypothetical protein
MSETDISGLSNGAYFVKIITSNGETATLRFVKN